MKGLYKKAPVTQIEAVTYEKAGGVTYNRPMSNAERQKKWRQANAEKAREASRLRSKKAYAAKKQRSIGTGTGAAF